MHTRCYGRSLVSFPRSWILTEPSRSGFYGTLVVSMRKLVIRLTIIVAILAAVTYMAADKTPVNYNQYQSVRRSHGVILDWGWEYETTDQCLALATRYYERGFPFVVERGSSPCGTVEYNQSAAILNIAGFQVLPASIVIIAAARILWRSRRHENPQATAKKSKTRK